MRTTVEITDEQRSKLLALAAAKGIKGLSRIVQQALNEYLSKDETDAHRVELALTAMGTLDDDEARELAESCASLRKNWR